MNARRTLPLMAGCLVAAAPMSHAALAPLAPYHQNFEGMPLAASFPGSNAALGDDGWVVFVNVFNADNSFAYQYGTFAAPNGEFVISGVFAGAGGPAQGQKQLSVYNDYSNSPAHDGGQWVQTNVYQVRELGAADVGTTWVFSFDARNFNLSAPSTAQAFIETRDPLNGFQVVDSAMVQLSGITNTWANYALPLQITATAGQIIQFGFTNTASGYDSFSTVLYDNVALAPVPEASSLAMFLAGLGVFGLLTRRRPETASATA
jgi:hypothetical protein